MKHPYKKTADKKVQCVCAQYVSFPRNIHIAFVPFLAYAFIFYAVISRPCGELAHSSTFYLYAFCFEPCIIFIFFLIFDLQLRHNHEVCSVVNRFHFASRRYYLQNVTQIRIQRNVYIYICMHVQHTGYQQGSATTYHNQTL